jgi:L-alanine-DL-glutamate epimerase-like enolase superfamily enzyme
MLARWAVPVLAEPFVLTACRLVFPDRRGCGIEWDERAVRRFRLAT